MGILSVTLIPGLGDTIHMNWQFKHKRQARGGRRRDYHTCEGLSLKWDKGLTKAMGTFQGKAENRA